MTVREELEHLEHRTLHPKAAFADQSRGRPHGETLQENDVRTCYQRDTDRIVHSKAFRPGQKGLQILQMLVSGIVQIHAGHQGGCTEEHCGTEQDGQNGNQNRLFHALYSPFPVPKRRMAV